MPTIERSTQLLAGASSVVGLTAIARELGFAAPLPLDSKARATLGLPEEIAAANVARGPGALRALIVEIPPRRDIPQLLSAAARVLSRQTAQLLWIVLASDGESVVLLCWSANRSRPRIVSLVCKRSHMFASDAETLSSLVASLNESDLLTYARWIDVLGRVSITRKFFRELEAAVALLADSLPADLGSSARQELALICVSRLIFLSFLETKGWLDGDFCFLENGFSVCIERGGRYQIRILEPLFFGTLNTPVKSRAPRARQFGRIPFLNGGLFSRSLLEKRVRRLHFSDEAFGGVFGSLLSRYRFTAREDSADWSEASIDPEILGKSFEALMGSATRKGSGAFYTPQDLVEHLTNEALTVAAPADLTLTSLCGVRVLDPACGSGAFLVHMLERLASLRRERGETGSVAEIRRRVLASSIFGVDQNPTAVWLCELRLWLSVVVETDEGDPMRVIPLPNLDRHIRVGDSLAGGRFGGTAAVSGKKLQALRARYMRATGPRKLTLARALDRSERDAAAQALSRSHARLSGERKELLLARRSPDLFGLRHAPTAAESTRLLELRRQMRAIALRIRALKAGGALPFSFEAHFSDAAAAGGFDIVIGNPPWVRLHRIPAASRQSLRRDFVVYREAAWRKGAALAGAGRGFAAQVDMAALFVERSHGLVKDRGIVALLLPAKLWRSLAGGGVRRLLAEETELLLVEDRGDSKSGFDAAVYPAIFVCRAVKSIHPAAAPPALVRCDVRSRRRTVRWKSLPRSLPLDDTAGSPWLLVPPAVRRSFDRVRERGLPLAESSFGRPLLGVKTGFNEAFIVRVASVNGGIAEIAANGRCSTIEAEMLRPTQRGESIGSEREANREHIVWPHDSRGRVLKSLPPLAKRWLDRHRSELSRRTDLHSRHEWWTVFRTESAANGAPRVIWADIGRRPRAVVAAAGDSVVPLNTCYVVPCASLLDARALAALINGPLVAAWLDLIAEPARGDYRRYLGWTMALLPIPAQWNAARVALATAGSDDAERLDAALSAYCITREDVEPLLSVESAFGIASPAAVRALIAQVMLGPEQPEPPLGSIELQPHQTVVIERLMSALHEFGGALLCDEVGMGKTFVALAVARRFGRALVVAPAALEKMWRDALSRADVVAGFVSYERLSRRNSPDTRADLLILDEAHHARNPATHRYGHIAQLARHGAVLMLTATPVHNRRVDLVALLSLFLGSRAAGLTDAESARCVVRRDSRTNVVIGIPALLPVVGCDVPDDSGLVDLLLAVPPPLPARDAGEAGSLINRGLVHQWASSEAALIDALRRRVGRARALASSLEAGRYPSAHELEAWTLGDGALQLGFSELLAPATPDAGALLESVTAHAIALQTILSRQSRESPIDDARSECLLRVRSAWPEAKIVAFAQYSATVSGLYRRLMRSERVAMLTAKGAQVAGGRLSRNEAIARFAPTANRSRQPARAEVIDLLVTTDILSEGVNLQDAQVVVHLDVPWTAARLEQRVGRVARMGSRHPHVMVYQIRPPASAEAVLGGERLVIGKRQLACTLAGDASIQSRVECLRRILKRWASEPVAGTQTDRVLAATVTASEARFIGAGYLRKVPVLLIGLDTHVTTDVDAQIAACLGADGDAGYADDAEYERARRVIQQWADCNAASDSAGLLGAPPVNRRRLLNRVDATLQNAPPHLRASRASLAARARLIASAAHCAAVEQELETFIQSQMPDDDWLKGLASITVGATASPGTGSRFELLGLLLLRP